MYNDISDQLVTILEGISAINIVYAYEAKELTKYPAATVTKLGHADSFHDTAANKRIFSFMIRFYYRTDAPDDAESILGDVVDAAITAIEANPTLNGVCDWANPTSSKWLYQDREVPVRVVELTIDAIKRINR